MLNYWRNVCLKYDNRTLNIQVDLKAHYKKAIVTLKEGNVINLFTEN